MTDTVAVTQAVATRFWAKADVGADDQCWPWRGARASTGYGRFYIDRIGRPAAQVAWEIAHNCAFPRGMHACHSCDNPPCVNPKHIWAGTQSENIRDAVAKGRHASRPLYTCKRGHSMTGNNRVPTTGGFRCRECSRANTRERTRRYRARKAS